MSDYLQDLNERLAAGIARLPEATRHRHAQFLASKQNPDGGFPDREGGSDLYYTGFALRGLSVLDALTPEICDAGGGLSAPGAGDTDQRRRFLLVPVRLRPGAGVERHRRARRQPRRLADTRGRRARRVSHEGPRLQQVAWGDVGQHVPHVPGRALLRVAGTIVAERR